MRQSIRYTGIAVLCAAMLAAGPASARGRHHGGGGSDGAVAALAVGAIAALAIGAAVYSQPVVAAPAPVYAPPQPVAYAAPQVPPGYCYSNYQRAYVPCAPAAPVGYGQVEYAPYQRGYDQGYDQGYNPGYSRSGY
ncbi:hypothetical protein D3C87_1130970 [compost metagenome]|uniref:mechanosensitive ion channel protein MscS n=1 Tax=Cupriavidus sp. SIMBA_020 TaxID=3085766 RepID=UPI000FA6996C